MPMPVMPSEFEPVVSSYSFGAPDGAIESEVAGGVGRFGLAYDRGVQRYNVTLILDPLMFAVWNAFWHVTIKLGTITFGMQLDSGFGTEQHSCNVVPGSYSATRTGGASYSVSFVVKAESPAYLMSESDALGFAELWEEYTVGAVDILDGLAQFALVDSLALDF